MPIDEKSFEIARAGLSLLGSLQEQKRNAQPNIPFGFSVSSPKFSMSAQPRPPETDALKGTIEQLTQIQKQREKVFKEQEALDAALGKSQLGQQLMAQGLRPEVKMGSEGTQTGFAVPTAPFADQLAASLQQQFGMGQGAPSQSFNQQVTAQTPGAQQLPSGGYGLPMQPQASAPVASSQPQQQQAQPQGLALRTASAGGLSAVNLDTEQAIQRIQNLAPDKASDTEKKSLGDLVNSMTGMDALLNFANENRDVLEAQLGPLKVSNFPGSVGQFVRRMKSDTLLSALSVEAETTFQQVRAAITGAQASAKELELLRPLTPDLRDPLPVFVAKTLAFRKASERILANKLNVLEAGGTEVSDLRKFMNETLAITEAEYKIQLIENGVDPEQATKLASLFGNSSRKELSGISGTVGNKGLSDEELSQITSF